MKISHKLLCISCVPLLAFLVVSVMYARIWSNEKSTIVEIRHNIDLFIPVSRLIHELQKERGLTSAFRSGASRSGMDRQRGQVDAILAELPAVISTASLSAGQAQDFNATLKEVAVVRQKVEQGGSLADLLADYGGLIARLLEHEKTVANLRSFLGIDKIFTTVELLENAKESAGRLRAALSGVLTADKGITMETFQRLVALKAQMDANVFSKTMVLVPEGRQILNAMQNSQPWQDADKAFYAVLAHYGEGNFGVPGEVFFKNMTAIIDTMANVRDIEFAALEKNMNQTYVQASATLTRLYSVMGGAVLLILVMVVLVIRSINGPIKTLINYANNVASGRLDVPQLTGMRHELGALCTSLNIMIANLEKMLRQSEQASQRAHEESEKAHVAMEQAEEAKIRAERAKAEGMLAAAAQLEGVVKAMGETTQTLEGHVLRAERGADQQASHITETATAMEEMNATVLEVARNAGQASDASGATREKAGSGASVVHDAINSMETVRQQSLKLRQNMAQLDDDAKGITQIMGVISDIADQTNLLALNAAIEAARAGDAGRGFAVVADEVRKLAEKTMASTTEVGRTIAAIQASARESTSQMDEAVISIEEATHLVNLTGTALQEIVNMADVTADQVHAIATAAEQQSATSEEINRSLTNINGISGEVVDIMHESAKAVQEVSTQADVLNGLMEEMKKSSSV
ncbi:methyl-accepting chemotaxis protein [Desulfovibrio sp.]|uniref:methyl-accepting chemotaxis protein n=1 Tax=Desulfovibrio sp. TaxID=885 RepID=UPI003D0AD14D